MSEFRDRSERRDSGGLGGKVGDLAIAPRRWVVRPWALARLVFTVTLLLAMCAYVGAVCILGMEPWRDAAALFAFWMAVALVWPRSRIDE